MSDSDFEKNSSNANQESFTKDGIQGEISKTNTSAITAWSGFMKKKIHASVKHKSNTVSKPTSRKSREIEANEEIDENADAELVESSTESEDEREEPLSKQLKLDRYAFMPNKCLLCDKKAKENMIPKIHKYFFGRYNDSTHRKHMKSCHKFFLEANPTEVSKNFSKNISDKELIENFPQDKIKNILTANSQKSIDVYFSGSTKSKPKISKTIQLPAININTSSSGDPDNDVLTVPAIIELDQNIYNEDNLDADTNITACTNPPVQDSGMRVETFRKIVKEELQSALSNYGKLFKNVNKILNSVEQKPQDIQKLVELQSEESNTKIIDDSFEEDVKNLKVAGNKKSGASEFVKGIHFDKKKLAEDESNKTKRFDLHRRFLGHLGGSSKYGSGKSHTKSLSILNELLNIVWDPCHVMNLAVTSVVKGVEKGSFELRNFLSRLDHLSKIYSLGRGHSEYEYKCMAAKSNLKSLAVNTFNITQFLGSAIVSLDNVFASFESIILAFDNILNTNDPIEEVQYLIKGYDFVIMMLLFTDVFKPISEMMKHCQSVDLSIWQPVIWLQKVINHLTKMHHHLKNNCLDLVHLNAAFFPFFNLHATSELLNDSNDDFCNNSTERSFKNVKLVIGWLDEDVYSYEKRNEVPQEIVSVEISRKRKSTTKKANWFAKENNEVAEDVTIVIKSLYESLQERLNTFVAHQENKLQKFASIFFDFEALLNLLCTAKSSPSSNPEIDGPSFELYGNAEFQAVYKIILKMTDIQEHLKQHPGLDFNIESSDQHYIRFKDWICDSIWNTKIKFLCLWFPSLDSIEISEKILTSFQKSINPNEGCLLLQLYTFKFDDGSSFDSHFDEASFLESLFVEKEIYEHLGKELMIIIEVLVSTGGNLNAS